MSVGGFIAGWFSIILIWFLAALTVAASAVTFAFCRAGLDVFREWRAARAKKAAP